MWLFFIVPSMYKIVAFVYEDNTYQYRVLQLFNGKHHTVISL
jgi:hypothetical protein